MKKYLVIGNPIAHSLSPKLHNYWYKKNNINAIYEKEELNEEHFKDLFLKLKKNQINGINVTVPFKNKIIPFINKLSVEADKTQSVNTIYLDNDQIVGHNTDIIGFQESIKDINFDLKGKKILILGAGGVVPSIIFALKKMNVLNIIVSNRTKDKAIKLKSYFKNITIVDWGEIPDTDMIINATSVGLKNDKLDLDFSKTKTDKLFYDVIYNPEETEFLKTGKSYGNKTENGGKMFIYQAAAAFEIWHGVKPIINQEIEDLLY